MANDLYKAPEAELEVDEIDDIELASRLSRLGASIVDSLIMMAFMLPLMFAFGMFDYIANGEQPSFLYNLSFALVGFVLFFAINFKFLKDSGQTLGKKVAGIQIVALNGEKAEMGSHIAKRYLTYFVPGQIPVLGAIFNFVNILFIFKKDKRCIHDLAGGTKVVAVVK